MCWKSYLKVGILQKFSVFNHQGVFEMSNCCFQTLPGFSKIGDFLKRYIPM